MCWVAGPLSFRVPGSRSQGCCTASTAYGSVSGCTPKSYAPGLEAARLGAIATFGPEGSTVMPSVLPAQVMLDAPLRSPADPPGPASSSSRPQAGYSIPSRPPAATSPETTMVAWAVD
jgi:hypothetical protein